MADSGVPKTAGAMEPAFSWGPPTGEDWYSVVSWHRGRACPCGYMGTEIWSERGPNTFVCTKCGRTALPPTNAELKP